jgi:predicted dehydrogenase
MSTERIGVVVIGTGGIGKYHLKMWNEIPTAEVVGIYDIVPDAAKKASETYGVKKIYGALPEALAEPRALIADICTPNMFHKEGTVAALQAGKHTICEKPLATTATEIRAMIAARDKARRLLMTAQHMRFEQRTQTLRRMITAGRLGEIYYTRAWWLRRRLAPNTPGFLKREQAGYGPGMDIGVHVLDLSMYLMDHPRPVSVSGIAPQKLAKRPDVCNQWGTWRPEDFEVEDFAAGFVRFENGAALTLEVSWLLNMVEPETYSVALHGTEGGARWPELKLAHVQEGVLVDTQAVSGTGTDGHKNALAAFVDAVRTGGPSPVPAEQSLAVGRVLEGLYQSAATGREIRLE